MIAAFIPIKTKSERVPRKNFRVIAGKKLYMHIINNAINSQAFDAVYVDTDSAEVKDFSESLGAKYIERQARLTENDANGNDLLHAHHKMTEGMYSHYFQLFTTSPFLQPETIYNCVKYLLNNDQHDSIFTATEETGWFWCNGLPINFRPGILPRSQDAVKVVKESTGLYGISEDSLRKYKCRIGRKPYIYLVDPVESVDLDTEDDFTYANYIWKQKMEGNI